MERLSQFFTRTYGVLNAPRWSTKDQALFIKRLAFLIKSGLPIRESLAMLRDQSSPRSRHVLERIIDDIENGRSLSTSIAKFPGLFDEFAVHIVSVGERSGTLAENLSYLADELKKKQQLRRKVIGAFIYPLLITAATLMITLFLILYLFPKIMPVFTSMHIELPLTTRMVIAASTFFMQWGLFVALIAAVAVVVFFIALKKNVRLKYIVDRVIMRIPIIGTCTRTYHVASGSRTLSLLLKSGMPIREALVSTAQTTAHSVYREAWSDMAAYVHRGENISVLLGERRDCFPEICAHMVKVGERSGTLPETLTYLSELYETEVDEFTKNLSTLIEPVLMIVCGLIIGFIALSIIMPIYGITQNLHG